MLICKLRGLPLAAIVAVLFSTGCKVEQAPAPSPEGGSTTTESTAPTGGALDGKIAIDGSSTVYPISAAIGEEFMGLNAGSQVNVAQSGTGGGFKKFVRGETDISDASRPIKDSEAAQAKEAGIEYVELTVAIDGISVVVNPENPIESITTAQLKQIFEAGSTVKKWSDVDPTWPDEEITLYGPDSNSGTFDYFNEVILDEGSPRTDGYKPSEDDNVLVTGVAGDKFALGYFGYSYYVNNKDRVKALAIAEGDGEAVPPTPENIESGKYTPLARPLFIYVNKAKVAESPTLAAYLKYYVSDAGQTIIAEEDFVQLSPEALEKTRGQVAELAGE